MLLDSRKVNKMFQPLPIGRHLLVGGIVGVVFLGLSPAFAQSMQLPGVPGGKNVTCREFLRLGAAKQNEVVYFANGYATGVEDQVAAGTPSVPIANTALPSSGNAAPKASQTAPLNALSALPNFDLDQLRAVCGTDLDATVLSKVPGGSPITGSGTITGSTSGTSTNGSAPGDDGAGVTSGAVHDTTSPSTGTSASSEAAQALSAQMSVTSPGRVTVNPATGIAHATPETTTSAGAVPSMPAVPLPTAGPSPGGASAAPGSPPSIGVPTAASPSK